MKLTVEYAIKHIEATENTDLKAHELLVKLDKCWNARNHDGVSLVQNEIVEYVNSLAIVSGRDEIEAHVPGKTPLAGYERQRQVFQLAATKGWRGEEPSVLGTFSANEALKDAESYLASVGACETGNSTQQRDS